MDSDKLTGKINELNDMIRYHLPEITGQKFEIEMTIVKWDLQFRCKLGNITALSSCLSLDFLVNDNVDIDRLAQREARLINWHYIQKARELLGE